MHQNRNFSSVFDVQRPFRVKGLQWIQSKSQFFLSFWRPTSISYERVAMGQVKIAILPQFLTSNVHFVRKGCDGLIKSQFFLSFWRPTSISCERVARDTSKSQFFFSLWRPTSISCERVAMDTSKSQFYLSFWRPTSISCEGVAFRGAPAAAAALRER